jgi:uncharacterized protein (DUF362 family)
MDPTVNVAVVRSDNRRGAVAQALALIAPEIRAVIADEVLIKPNLVSHHQQGPSTHADALSATIDAVLGLGARQVVVAEGATDASAGFNRFGYHREAWGRPVRFFDLNREETEWDPIALSSVRGTPLVARISRTIAGAACRVSLALAKTHVTSMVTFSMKNMLSSIHPDDRVMMHGYEGGGNGYSGWKGFVVDFLKKDNVFVNRLTRVLGRLRAVQSRLQGKTGPEGWRRLTAADRAFLASVESMNRNLVTLTKHAGPHLSVVDGFMAMHREGPRHGTPIRLGTVVAGTDPVAVDSVAAAIMGFDPRQVGYLRYAQDAGLGVADLDRITIVGDPIERVRRRCVPHSNYAIQRHWGRRGELVNTEARPSAVRGPHGRVDPIPEERRR